MQVLQLANSTDSFWRATLNTFHRMDGATMILHSLLFTFVAAVINVEQAFTENEISPRLIPVAPTKLVNVKSTILTILFF